MTPPETLSPTDETETWQALEDALQSADANTTKEILQNLDAEDQARAVSRLSQERRESLADTLSCKDFAQLLQELPEAQAIEILGALPNDKTASAVGCLPPETSSRLLRELEEEDSAEILEEIEDSDSLTELKSRLEYEEGCAGSLMRGSPVSFPQNYTVQKLLDDLHQHADDYSDRDIQYLYVVDENEKLKGVLQLRQLFWASRSKLLQDLMIPDPLSVSDQMDFHDLAEIFKKKAFLGLPVVDADGRLLGVVPRDTVQRETSDEQTELYLQSQGIVDGEELRSMPLFRSLSQAPRLASSEHRSEPSRGQRHCRQRSNSTRSHRARRLSPHRFRHVRMQWQPGRRGEHPRAHPWYSTSRETIYASSSRKVWWESSTALCWAFCSEP